MINYEIIRYALTTYKEDQEATTETLTTNTYNDLNQLITTQTKEGKTITNTYNGEGYRTQKQVDNKTTYYLYEYDKIILELDQNGNETVHNIYGINLIKRTINNDETETYYYLYNGHADVVALITPEGTLAATYYYDAFGNIKGQKWYFHVRLRFVPAN